MSLRKLWFILPVLILVVLAGLWLARARLAADLAEGYFRQNHIASSISFDHLGLSGLSGRIALGPAEAPDFSADAMEVDFDPLSLVPRITQVRLVHPVVRATVSEDGKINLPTLQAWLDQLSNGSGHSRYVSDDLAISFTGLRALLVTPGGALELDGDAKVQKNSLISAAITAKPTALSWRGYALQLASAKLSLNAINQGYAVDAALQGTFDGLGLHLDTADVHLSAPMVSWTNNQLAVPGLVLRLDAASVSDQITAIHPSIELEARDIQFGSGKDARAYIQLHAGADFTPPSLTQQLPILARDPRLVAAVSGNLKHLDVRLDGDVAQTKDGITFSLLQPLDINGAQGGHLRLSSLALSGPLDALSGNLDAALSGPGLPVVTLRSRSFHAGKDGVAGDVTLAADFTFDMLRQAHIQANGSALYAQGVFNFALTGCTPVTLASFRPGGSNMADGIKGAICPQGAQTFTADNNGWRFSAAARDAVMTVPLANVALEGGAGVLAFSGKGAAINGKVTIATARMTDRTATSRFEPLNGSGEITLADWIWQGQIAVADDAKNSLGTANFHHVLAGSQGGMTISAPHLEFAASKLQPRMLSRLMGSFTHVEGAAKFDGAVNWSPAGFDSHGTFQVQQLDFLTPLGTAHAFNATIVLSSLLPPVTAPGQHIAIGKIDWALPLSGVAVDFSFGNGELKLERASTTFSEGNLKLGAINLDFSKPLTVNSEADLSGISLAPLVAASNLGDKIKLEGKVTGSLPFTYGPDGIRIVNGHLKADGPGRIALDPAIWTQGGTQPVNAIQDMAYQAMENLSFDELSADVNSVANGRLQVVLHVKGRNDPPKPQQAEIAVADVFNGTALQKKIDLPSGTPIDLTLDTSLNFDQLLKSYAEAWSKALQSSH